MKITTYILSFLLLNVLVLNAQNVQSTIEEISLFPHSAQITREAQVNLKKGKQTLVFKSLANNIQPNSIRVQSSVGKILSVKHSNNYMEHPQNSAKHKIYKDSLELVQNEIKKVKFQQDALKMELDLIKSNQNIKGNTTLKSTEIKEILTFYKNTLPQIQNKLISTENQLKTLQVLENQLNNQIKNISGLTKLYVGEIEVEIESDNIAKTELELLYVCYNAGWQPHYNIRAFDVNKDIELEYTAIIHQNTGENWKETKIILATGNPDINSTAPNLYPWVLNNQTEQKHMMRQAAAYDNVMLEEAVPMAAPMKLSKSEFKKEQTEQMDNLVFSAFTLAGKHTIDNGTNELILNVQNHQLNTAYQYFAIPKLSDKVFLRAYITNWQNLGLIPGKSSIYYQNTYISNSYLNPNTIEDSLSVSLGFDKNIVLERKKVKEERKNQTLSNKQNAEFHYQITVKNNKNSAINILIEDQYPIAYDQQIKIENKQNDKAKVDVNEGKLSWETQIPAQKSFTVNNIYEISFPKKYRLNL
jgi:uncharacterized protein (TIGR02231 family)